MQTLQPQSTLQQGKYTIQRVLGQGGFGITYEGLQGGLNRRVAIKEFFMSDSCERNGLEVTAVGTQGTREQVSLFREKFIKEAQLIATLDKAPHVVRIYDIFEENRTAYFVMEFIEGGSLGDLVKRDGPLSEACAISLISQTAQALAALHRMQTVHLDVKPSNILVRQDQHGNDDVVLIDFGVSKHYDREGHQTTSTPVGLSKGFAPLEQYREGGVSEFSPATDVYSLGGTLYYLLTGVVPPEAANLLTTPLVRPSGISDAVWQVITRSMSIRPADRYQSMDDMVKALGQLTKLTKTQPQKKTETPSKVKSVETKLSGTETVLAKRNNRFWPILPIALPIVVAILFAILFALFLLVRSCASNQGHVEYVDSGKENSISTDFGEEAAENSEETPEEADGSLLDPDAIKCRRTIITDEWVYDAAFSLDGHRIVASVQDKTIRVFDVSTGSCLSAVEGNNMTGDSHVAYGPDGHVASALMDKVVRIWDDSTGECLHAFSGHTERVGPVAFSPEGRFIASGSQDKTIRVWNISTGECLRVLEHSGRIGSVAYSSDGRYLISTDWGNNSLRLWDASTGECIRVFEGHRQVPCSAVFTPDNKFILSSAADESVCLWDVATGECVRTFSGHTHSVVTVAVSPNGRYALSGALDGTIRLWDISTGECLRTFRHDSSVEAVAFSPDGRSFLSASGDRTIKIWGI